MEHWEGRLSPIGAERTSLSQVVGNSPAGLKKGIDAERVVVYALVYCLHTMAANQGSELTHVVPSVFARAGTE